MKKAETKEETLVAYPVTDMFTFLVDELAEEAERVLKLVKILKVTDRGEESYYDAMAQLYASLTHLEMHVPETIKEMENLENLFPDEDE